MSVFRSGGIKAVIFDLGGVVIDIDFQKVFDSWAAKMGQAPALNSQTLCMLDAYQSHERDEIDFDKFYREVNQQFQLGISQADFELGWNEIFIGAVPGVDAILRDLSRRHKVCAFSNTNLTHEKVWRERYSNLINNFHSIFTSTSLAMRKPEQRAYLCVLRALDCQPNEVLFLDDHQQNVDAASRVGIHSRRVCNAKEIQESLSQFNLLDA